MNYTRQSEPVAAGQKTESRFSEALPVTTKYRAWYESDAGNEFEAYGKNAEQATATLIQTMEFYGDRQGKPRTWWQDEDLTGIVVTEIEIDVGYLDAMVYMKRQ